MMIVSPAILTEYENVLRRPRFKLEHARIDAVLNVIRTTSVLVNPQRTLSISRDESDNRFYECAEAGKADYIVTGNTKHFPVRHKETRTSRRANLSRSSLHTLPVEIVHRWPTGSIAGICTLSHLP